jgi:serine/threonine-protein kinase
MMGDAPRRAFVSLQPEPRHALPPIPGYLSLMDPAVGRRFGKVRVVEQIGQGAMGLVYRGVVEPDGREVAVKTLARGHGLSTVQRFVRECRLASAVRHPNVVRVHGSAAVGGEAYLVLEFVKGEDLLKRLDRVGKLPLADAMVVGADVAAGLAAIHAAGIIHRDLKPDNILLDEQGRAKIADLGLAKCFRETDAEQLTKTGYVVGTALYVAPECIRAPKTAGPPCDMYGFGATLFHALAGKPPFDGENVFEIMRAHLDKPPVQLRSLRQEVVPEVARLIDGCLAKDPAARPKAEVVAKVLSLRANGGRTPRS